MYLPFLLMLSLALPVAADEVNYNQVNLSVDASRQVENDLLVATLFVQHEGSDPAELSGKVNQDMAWALETAKQQMGVQAQTLAYNSSPMYDKNRLTGWRVRQELMVEGKDMAVMAELVGKLQVRLAVQSVGYRVSDEVRRQVEEQLIVEALKNFEARAKLVTANLGRKGYKLVNLNINQHSAPPVRQSFRGVAMMAEAAAPAPAFEAGNQQMSLSIGGVIEVSQD